MKLIGDAGNKRSTRLVGFDALRGFMIVCVVALHAAMTYMAFVPAWWYVKDTNDSFFLALLVVAFDSFPMTVLFFLAGYFAPPSLERRTKADFIKDKFLRIGIAWIAGVVLFAPGFALATYRALGYPAMPYLDFVKTLYLGPLYQQGHYWFLGVLLAFFIAFSFFGAGKRSEEPGAPPSLSSITLIWLIGSIAYYLSSTFLKPADEWLNVGYVLYFQPARLLHYAMFFLLGVTGWRRRWFTSGGWRPNATKWSTAALVAISALLVWQFGFAGTLNEAQNRAAHAVLFNFAAVTVPFALVALCLSTIRSGAGWISFGSASYGVYWLHMMILMLVQYAMVNLTLPVMVKFFASVAATYIICQPITIYILLKLPGLRKVFGG